jgi:hypothetical protein
MRARRNSRRVHFSRENRLCFFDSYCGAELTAEVLDQNCNTLGYLGDIQEIGRLTAKNFQTRPLFEPFGAVDFILISSFFQLIKAFTGQHKILEVPSP